MKKISTHIHTHKQMCKEERSDNNKSYPLLLMVLVMTSIDLFITSMPTSLSKVIQVMTYIGGAISLILTWWSFDPASYPEVRSSLIASIPAYLKHVTYMSAPILTDCGARLRLM